MFTEVVVRNRRFHNTLDKNAYKVVLQRKGVDIPKDVILSDAAIENWKITKNVVGLAGFDSLDNDDIISILSAVKRNEASLNVNRHGQAAFYKIGKVDY